jgi:rRNA small subunit pseudouridine methyltransferase Nep1
MPLNLILAEAALELVPESMLEHPSVIAHAKRRKRRPDETILDRNYHYSAMKPSEKFEKRGRPDIVHFSVLEALGTPLNKEGQLQTWIHTVRDEVVRIDPKARLPRNYDRFVSLMEQLLVERSVPPQGPPLLTAEVMSLRELVESIQPTELIALSTLGQPSTLESICCDLAKTRTSSIMIGCFPRGHLDDQNARLASKTFRIDREALESWVVVSRTIYEYERTIEGFHQRRLTGNQ